MRRCDGDRDGYREWMDLLDLFWGYTVPEARAVRLMRWGMGGRQYGRF